MESYRETLSILRKSLPIGIQHAITLLKQYEGDVEMVAQQFKADTLSTILEKTQVDPQTAHRLLVAHQYDVPKTLLAIDQEQFTLTERILRSEGWLDTLVRAIFEATQIQSTEPWFSLATLTKFPSRYYPLLLIWDWLMYLEWEGFDYAVTHPHMDMILQELENTFSSKEMAAALQEARNRKTEFKEKHFPDTSAIQSHCDFYNSLNRDASFLTLEKAFQACRAQLEKELYEYVQIHINEFPK